VAEQPIIIRGAREHNLKGLDVEIPRGRLTVVTGVSGSGKSSLAFDTLFREGQRRFLETLPAFSRQFAGGFARPAVTALEGIGPAVAVSQRAGLSNPRSTVGTLTEVWDLLRLLFARLGEAPEGVRPTRGLFSFNGEGACPACQGLGVEDRLDLDLLVADAARSLREGALRVSTPNGYLMYSQVTLAVLDEVLRSHGGSVDIPWQELSEEVRQVVLYGSERLKVPYGKHPLESRLKWTGITARPRQEGFYRGLVPVMEEILRGKRNDSILRFVRSTPCAACGGMRLRPEALAVTWRGRRITELAALTAAGLADILGGLPDGEPVLDAIRKDLAARCGLMAELGLDYLAFDRPAPTLSLGEVQRLRLLGLALGELQGLLVVLDEPSAGLHPEEAGRLLGVLRRLRDQGQTVVVVEHDATLARAADWLIDLGPGPGKDGGELLWSGPPAALATSGADTPTARWLSGRMARAPRSAARGRELGPLAPVARRNLQGPAPRLRAGALNVLSGVSGSGKSTLLDGLVEQLGAAGGFKRVVRVDAAPIGRTPRSNAATYSGAFDLIRDLFAATPEARARGLGKGHFTFNTPGGRCEACEGAGVIEVGMRHLGSVDLVCEACGGRRFHPDVLAVAWEGRSIADVLEGSIAEAATLFAGQPKLRRILAALLDCGLGYLSLGQPATTLSGGEAQRVKLATELARAGTGASLVALDEPATGLHAADVAVLLQAWDRLVEAGHTLLVADNDPAVLRAADHLALLEEGRIAAEGLPSDLRDRLEIAGPPPAATPMEVDSGCLELRGVTTHNLKGVDADLPARGLTVVTGPSGSGKSSLVFDTLLAEAQNRFSDLVSPWARRLLPRRGGAELVSARGLRAAVAVPQIAGRRNPRSRVGTVSELDELLRMLYARAGEGGTERGGRLASAFSPNGEAGACPRCKGLGFVQGCDPRRLVDRPDLPLPGGAMGGTRFGAYLGEADGRFVATLRTVGAALGLDFDRPWSELDEAARRIAMHGAGERIFDVAWHYRRGRSEGVHRLSTAWEGFAALVDREYERVHLKEGGDAEALEALLADRPCPACLGERLKPESRAVTFHGKRLPELTAMTLDELDAWLGTVPREPLTERLCADLRRRIAPLREAGLGYLSAGRETASLSGGELQRLCLASALGGGLTGVVYALDEPTQGLHPRDTERLAGVLRALARDNAVVVVEHDPGLIARADHVLELGPGAGPEGGRLLRAGPPVLVPERPASRPARTSAALAPGLTVRGARLHNLQDLELTFPAGALTVVTGVSGSGKSSLVHGVVGETLARGVPTGCSGLELHAALEGVQRLGQRAATPGGLSTVATLAGLAEPLRKRFAATAEAKARKLTARHFSTAAPGGRCEACEGRGVVTVAMDLLPDVTVGCEVCQGRRFQAAVLACAVEGWTIADALESTLTELRPRFGRDAALARRLEALEELGLGYLRPGQEGGTLSAGELQRLRLAGLLGEREGHPSVILLDEPTRGLGATDVARLVDALRRLVRAGHLVIAVEHHLGFIAEADWVVDLGPEGGPGGGQLVAQGPPEAIAACPESRTGRALGK
jgi:excinuclease ABC subunit A